MGPCNGIQASTGNPNVGHKSQIDFTGSRTVKIHRIANTRAIGRPINTGQLDAIALGLFLLKGNRGRFTDALMPLNPRVCGADSKGFGALILADDQKDKSTKRLPTFGEFIGIKGYDLGLK